MTLADTWLLPDGIEEILPPLARNLELVRRRLLDLYGSWGYQYVIPPMVEFLESLLTGTGSDLDLKTFKVTDQVSGRMMGVRADITPQVARIDAHSLNRKGPVRLCYAGTVLHAKADNMLASRTPIRVGAELFDVADVEGELEIISLMLESLKAPGIDRIHLELGDVGIFRHLVQQAGISQRKESHLFELIQRKAYADLAGQVQEMGIDRKVGDLLCQLPTMMGESSILSTALKTFSGIKAIKTRIDTLSVLSEKIKSRFKNIDIYYDLSELRGYSYHTGIVFAAYVHGQGQAIAKGGRYDHIGEVFGRSRVAIGFDVDLKLLSENVTIDQPPQTVVVSNSGSSETGRYEAIHKLRNEGYTVIDGYADRQIADYSMAFKGGEWILEKVGGN